MRAIRIECFQSLANYRKATSFLIKETFPLPPYSTVIGMIHAACDFQEYHDMKVSIQGTNKGTISDLYTRYSFSAGTKYEEGRHQICIHDKQDYGIFKGIANTELVCENRMVIHIVPKEEDFERVLQGLKYPKRYLSLGRHEDIVDIQKIDVVNLIPNQTITTKRDIYIPVRFVKGNREIDVTNHFISETEKQELLKNQINLGRLVKGTIYILNKKYEITKNGIRRWDKKEGKFKSYYCPAGINIRNVCVDDYEVDKSAVVLV